VTAIRITIGLTLFAAGVFVMATIPHTDAATSIAAGWALTLAGIGIAGPAVLDALGVH
jgi:uncharacterized membrane protein HdeD (DUF308 family)